jgi:hypothetical protein
LKAPSASWRTISQRGRAAPDSPSHCQTFADTLTLSLSGNNTFLNEATIAQGP